MILREILNLYSLHDSPGQLHKVDKVATLTKLLTDLVGTVEAWFVDDDITAISGATNLPRDKVEKLYYDIFHEDMLNKYGTEQEFKDFIHMYVRQNYHKYFGS